MSGRIRTTRQARLIRDGIEFVRILHEPMSQVQFDLCCVLGNVWYGLAPKLTKRAAAREFQRLGKSYASAAS